MDPEKIGDILKKLQRKKEFRQKKKIQKIRNFWVQEVGKNWAHSTRLSSFYRGVLKIEVKNSALLQELSTFQKESLLSRLKEEFPEILDIKFILSNFED